MPHPPASSIPDHGIFLQDAALSLAGKHILSDLTLHLTEARIAIVGRNGSGKSSLMRLIAGLLPASAGQVRVEGVDPYQDRKAMLNHLGILFQNPDHQILFPTVGEELAFGLQQQGMGKSAAKSKVFAHLTQHHRAHWADAPISALSQGQRQWICLQSLLLMAPKTLLLDEPLSGLDLPAQMRLNREFSKLKQRLITITHDPAHAESAERVIWIERGKIHADGRPAEVLPRFTAAMQEEGARDADADLAG